MPLPFLTPRELLVTGDLKHEPEDFIVEEIPAYEPTGEGEHLYLWIEKRDISADFLAAHLARVLNMNRNDLGVAGLKDRRAITRQWVSVSASFEPQVDGIERDDIHVLKSVRHGNKLKTGHLRGNRFEILLRTTEQNAYKTSLELVELVNKTGVPNYFGDQRFGIDRSTLELGYELLRGTTSPAKIPFKKRKFLMRLALSSVQSDLFNQVLAERIQSQTIHKVLMGEVMQVRETGGVFVVEAPDVDQQRFELGEIVPTGPLFGPKMKAPIEAAAEVERLILEKSGLEMSHFEKFSKLTSGARRPYLVWPQELQVRAVPEGLWFCFSLPSGCYATVLLREFLKGEPACE